jgi:vitamin B12 transporter
MNKILLFFLLSCSQAVFAQELLDTATVSASRIKMKPYENGKHITMVSNKEIQNLPVQSVDELLQYVAGMNLNTRAAFGVQSDIGIRGSTFSQVVILIDNQRLNDPLTGHFNNNIPVPLSEIHHVEIIRGPGSVAFGSDAVGGVINVVTKTYWNMHKSGKKSNFQGQMGFGEHQLTLTDATAYTRNEGFGFSASVKSSQSEGPTYENPNYRTAGLGDSLYNAYFDLRTFTAAATYSGAKFTAYTRVGMDLRDFSAKYFYTASTFDESIETVEQAWAQTALSFRSEKATTFFQAGWKSNSDFFQFNPAFAPNDHTTNRLNSTLYQERTWRENRVAFGLQTDAQLITSTDRGDHELYTHALFATFQNTMDKLSLNGGLRMEYNPTIKLQVVPQVNLSYRHEEILFKASFGRSIRQADFTERFVSYNLTNLTPGRNAGNPDLRAESAWNGEVGLEKVFKSGWRFSNYLFIRTSTDLIDFIATDVQSIQNLTNLQDSGSYFYATNIGESSTWGNEFSLTYRKRMRNFLFGFTLNHTFLRTNIPDEFSSKYLANHPVQNLGLLAHIESNGVRLQIANTAVQRNAEEIPSIEGEIKAFYVLMNARVSYTLGPASLYMDVRNLLDTEYQEIMGARMPGRWLLAGLSWNIVQQ